MTSFRQRARQRGKRNEKMVASLFTDGERVGLLGKVDVHIGNLIFIECKERAQFPKYLVGACQQAVKYAKGKIPVVQLHTLGERYENDWYMIPFPVFKEFVDYLMKGGDDGKIMDQN